MIRNRRAVFVRGISSKVITDLEENGAIISRTGSRFWAVMRVFLTRWGVKRTWFKDEIVRKIKPNKNCRIYLKRIHIHEIFYDPTVDRRIRNAYS